MLSNYISVVACKLLKILFRNLKNKNQNNAIFKLNIVFHIVKVDKKHHCHNGQTSQAVKMTKVYHFYIYLQDALSCTFPKTQGHQNCFCSLG